RIRLADKGHKLLKQKRDVLIMEFFAILEQAKDIRGELNKQMGRSFNSLAIAEAYHGIFEVESAAMVVKKVSNVEIKVKNVMGVKIPDISGRYVKKSVMERGYSFVGSSAKIDEASDAFETSLGTIIELAKTENALKKLIREIEKTKRRVNALEYVLLPRLKGQARFISMKLDEMERSDFFTLKMIKKKMAARAKSTGG
ncbi:MAG: V-type ATP synthase subunit D, partial [Candidatus Micrarchaeota archaeon]